MTLDLLRCQGFGVAYLTLGHPGSTAPSASATLEFRRSMKSECVQNTIESQNGSADFQALSAGVPGADLVSLVSS